VAVGLDVSSTSITSLSGPIPTFPPFAETWVGGDRSCWLAHDASISDGDESTTRQSRLRPEDRRESSVALSAL
jgi:hypothetical protein